MKTKYIVKKGAVKKMNRYYLTYDIDKKNDYSITDPNVKTATLPLYN